MYKDMFKYGPPVDINPISKSQRNTTNINITKNLSNQVKKLSTQVTNVTENLTDIISTTVIENFTDIVNEYNTTIIEGDTNITNPFTMPVDILINSATLSDTVNKTRVDMKSNFQFQKNVIISNDGNFTDLSSFINFSIITDKPFYLDDTTIKFNVNLRIKDNDDNTIIHLDSVEKLVNFYQKIKMNMNNFNIQDNNILINDDNQLYLNEQRITNLHNDEIYNNISSWNIDNNNTTYTFNNVSINDSTTNNYQLNVNGSANFTSDVRINTNVIFNNNNRLYVTNNNLYYNDYLINHDINVGKDSIVFFFCLDTTSISLTVFENALKNELLSQSIDINKIHFELNDIVRVTCTVRTDSCYSELEKTAVKLDLQRIEDLINEESLTVTIGSLSVTAVANIYLYNNYYYFDKVSVVNAFKLVKRDNESFDKAILTGHQVYLKNRNNEYLKTDYTFSSSSSNKLLLEVHGYCNNFLTTANCIISIKHGFKLEVLPSLIVDLPSIIVGPSIQTEITFNSSTTNFTTSLTTITAEQVSSDPDGNFTNPGVSISSLEEALLSADINEYLNDSSRAGEVYLVDERWLTYKEICTDGSVVYGFHYADNYSDSKKFYNGTHFCSDLIIADYVFNSAYNLESIEEHGIFMFKNKHLPALKSANQINNLYNPEQRRENILEELEKAHIYIFQMNERMKKMEEIICKLTNNNNNNFINL